MKSISSRALGFKQPMTGLESVTGLPVVQVYLAEKNLKAGELMPGWEGWDKPHLMNMRHGGIVPTSPEMLLEDATAWAKEKDTGVKAWPCYWPQCDCSKHWKAGDREFCKGKPCAS